MLRIIFAVVLTVVSLGTISAQTGAARAKTYNLSGNKVAIEGYDPVAYFTTHRAIKGKSTIAYTYEGVTYNFANAQDMAIFKANPTQYEPQYGGWCAYAMGEYGTKVDVDPGTFIIVKGKLYLFYNQLLTNTLTSWNKNEAALLPKADKNWAKAN